ncbi:MAG: hypothetical protein DWI48_03715 [Chloroflexi bacterium]|nr:MAG: hypothetical protein DWI48_03715 [Chloroflexota bacterium]
MPTATGTRLRARARAAQPALVSLLGIDLVVSSLHPLKDRSLQHSRGGSNFILSQTLETVHLKHPKDFEGAAVGRPVLSARVEGKSSLARLGLLIHFTAPTIHNAFGPRPIVLEMICLAKVPLILKRGISICQLIIEQVDGEPVETDSQFNQQAVPTGEAARA